MELGVQLSETVWLTAAVPEPESEIVVGEFVALLFTTTLPETLPVVVGAKATANDVAWPGERVRGSARLDTVKPLPVTLSEESETPEFPVLVSVTVCVALVPVARLPKLRDVGDALSCSVAATVVPETLSKLAVANEELLLLLALTAKPIYTFCAMLIVSVVPTCTQFDPSAEAYPVKVFPLRTSFTQ